MTSNRLELAKPCSMIFCSNGWARNLQKSSCRAAWGCIERFLRQLGGFLGALGGILGALGGILGVLERSWGHLGWNLEILEGFWTLLGTFWAHHGASWESLGSVLGGLGGFQRRLWKHFWRISVHLKQFMKIAKHLGKLMVFH